jgi:hypothetical protein
MAVKTLPRALRACAPAIQWQYWNFKKIAKKSAGRPFWPHDDGSCERDEFVSRG